MTIRAHYAAYFITLLILTSQVDGGFFDSFTSLITGKEVTAKHVSKAVKKQLSQKMYDSLARDTKDLKIRIQEHLKPLDEMASNAQKNKLSINYALEKNNFALETAQHSRGLPDRARKPLVGALQTQAVLLKGLEAIVDRTQAMIERIKQTEAPACIAAIDKAQHAIEQARPEEAPAATSIVNQ